MSSGADFEPLLSSTAASASLIDRRNSANDRRRINMRSLIQGGLTPRRRYGRRAVDEHLLLDWHEPRLLIVSIAILLLSVADAFLTLALMVEGATEANPILAMVLEANPSLFAVVKMIMTGLGVTILVVAARHRVFKLVKVEIVLVFLCLSYAWLVAYEYRMLHSNL